MSANKQLQLVPETTAKESPNSAHPSQPLIRLAAPRIEIPDHPGVVPMPPRLRVQEAAPAAVCQSTQPTALDPEKYGRPLVAEMSKVISVAALEVISGSRSIQQLSRWLDARCFTALETRARIHTSAKAAHERNPLKNPVLPTIGQHAVARSVHCFLVEPGIYESTVVVADSFRIRAIALRLEEKRGNWKVTALQIG